MKRLLGTVGFPIKDWGLLENSPLNQFWECLLIWVCMKSATTNKQTNRQTNIPKGFGPYPTFGQDHGDVEISYL